MTFVKPEPETLTEFVRLSEKYPDNPVALFLRGDLMLKQGDEGGLHYLDEAVRRDPDFALQARQSMAEFHVRLGRHYEVEKIRERAFEDATRQHLDQELLDNLHPSLPYGPHSLTHEQVQDLVRQMRAVNTLGLAYLVKLTLPATGRQMHVVYALPKRKLIELGKEPADLVQRLTETVSFPSNTYVVSDPQNRKTWEKVLKAIPSSLILDQ